MESYKQWLVEELKEGLEADTFAEDFVSEIDPTSTEYIRDAISDYSDRCTSIYYSDIKDFIVNNFNAVEDAINEFGWDGCGGELYKAGQLAEYCQNQHILYDNLQYIIHCFACDYIDSTEEASNEAEATWNKLQDDEKEKIIAEYIDKFDQINSNNRFCDVVDIFDEFTAELENWGK